MTLLWPVLAIQLLAGPRDPVAVVTEYLEATRALDPGRMDAVLATEYRLYDSDGSSRLHRRELVPPITEWEKGMHTRWSYRILGVHGDTVTALLEEESDYFTLLGLERGIQVRSYLVHEGKIVESHGHLFMTAKRSQGEALAEFKQWFRANADRPEPEMIGPDGGLKLTGASAKPMLFWMRRWRAAVDSAGR